MKKFCFVVVVLVFAGCAFVAQNFNEKEVERLVLHMNKGQVVAHMGNPSKVELITIEGQEYEAWRYPIERFFAKRYNALDTSYYEVLFLEGKVVRWKKVKRVAQPEYDLKPLIPEGNIRTFTLFEGKQHTE